MEITEVRIRLMEEQNERLKVFCSITIDDSFVVRDMKIIEGINGPFVAMPSRKMTAHCNRCNCKNHLRAAFCNQCGARQHENQTLKDDDDDDGRVKLFADIAHPINPECREMIQDIIIEAFEEEKLKSQIPGYISSYDDFDLYKNGQRPSVVHKEFQSAEKMRGPHRRSEQHSPGPRDGSKESFGSSVFD